MSTKAGAELELTRRGEIARLLAGLLVAPAAWLLELQIAYMLVPWACAKGVEWPLHAVTILSLGAAAAGGLISWHTWGRAGREWPDQSAGAVPRSRFLAALGLMLSGLVALVILAQEIANLILSPCQL